MATLTIRNVDEETKRALRVRAARHGVSMEQEARTILEDAARRDESTKASKETGESLYAAIRRLVEPYGGFELDIPPRSDEMREPPKFG